MGENVPHTCRWSASGWVESTSTPECRRRLSTAKWSSEDEGDLFAGKSAYEVLEVPATSSYGEIKASFRRLAKVTHPDVSRPPEEGEPRASDSRRFLEIVAAYEILSDPKARACYDSFLLSRREVIIKNSVRNSVKSSYYNESFILDRPIEVVEWLKWYRAAVHEIVVNKKVVPGSSYFDKLQNEFYSALCGAYYGPLFDSMDLLPGCFEVEERSVVGTSQVLHLVSGRDLLGIVHVVDKVPELRPSSREQLTHPGYMNSEVSDLTSHQNPSVPEMQELKTSSYVSDAYRDLELHIAGSVVARATRIPPNIEVDIETNVKSEDQVNVYLSMEEKFHANEATNSCSTGLIDTRTLLGRISGLGTSAEEGSCSVYDKFGRKTHVILKHRTLMVKHMHWYPLGDDEVSVCECRCSRARLPPSKFWLFEPRSNLHDIGGWYVETFGRDKKGKTVPSARKWSAFDPSDKKLHPAMYLMALAYRTLDLEEARRRKRSIRRVLEPKLGGILRWCKKFMTRV